MSWKSEQQGALATTIGSQLGRDRRCLGIDDYSSTAGEALIHAEVAMCKGQPGIPQN